MSWDTFEVEVKNDQGIQGIMKALRLGDKEHVGLSMVENRLLYKGRFVILRANLLLKQSC